jgi:predicted ATPase
MFRIIKFTIHKHPLLEGNTFELTNPQEDETANYYSLIIGPNGTGKSYLLNYLIEAFNEIVLLKQESNFKAKKRFSLKYSLNGIEYFISTENREYIFIRNNEPVNPEEIDLPAKWIASSVTINDKYPILNYKRKLQIPQYKYLGIRSASNNAFISRITINTVFYFIEALKKEKTNQVLSVYEALGLNTEIQVVFKGGPMLKLEKKEGKYVMYRTESKLLEPHISLIKKNKSKTNYRVDNYKKYTDQPNRVRGIFEFIQTKRESFEKPSKASIQLKYKIDLSSREGISKLLADWDLLSAMLDLELIKISKFIITKNSAFRYEEASSGESHLLTSLHGIIANLENNSLLIIDEPEVSLHPNWQVEYIDILKSLLQSYTGINAVISLHSHLLVSSLKNEESRITSIKRNKKTAEIEVEELDFETYGWDPESILYNVFEVATMRNKYFELDLRKLISMVSNKDDKINEITRLKEKIEKYIMPNENDPLRLVILQAENYIKSRN